MKSKYLIAYFQPKGAESKSAAVAKAIESHMADKGHEPKMFAITPVEEYPTDPAMLNAATKTEVETRTRPAIVGKISDGYYHDVKEIILVAPNWWNSVPMAVLTFFDQHDSNYKRLVPVILHGGDGASKILEELREFLPKTDVMPAVEISNDELKGDIKPKVDKVMEELSEK